MNSGASSRMKWELADEAAAPAPAPIDEQTVAALIRHKSFAVHFQPIFSSADGSVFGYEALARVGRRDVSIDIGELFRKSAELNFIPDLDITCREAALRQAATLGIARTGALLFLNVCPETLLDPLHRVDATDELVEECQISKDRIVLEVTEEFAVKDYKLFSLAIAYYRDRGYKIAIDDFGAGYGGLKMLSMIEPDFVKIDRHFVSHIDRALVRYNLVDSVTTACHRMGIKVVAEGIERAEDLDSLIGLGVELLQGYYLARPGDSLQRSGVAVPPREAASAALSAEARHIGDIASYVEPVPPDATVRTIFERFMQDPLLKGLPVVEGSRAVGVLHRNVFLEQELLGKLGYGFALNSFKTAAGLVKDHPFLCVEFNQRLEEVSQKIQARREEARQQDICVTKNGKYHGTVTTSVLLKAITERSLTLARAANPLTGLPGNLYIQGEIEKRLSQNMHFDVSYVDIDCFKPFNDHYGFEKGDYVIQTLGRIAGEAVEATGDDFNFVGHIGGDDFIVVSRPQATALITGKIISGFESRRGDFHGPEDLGRGSYSSMNRAGERESFDLLTLSIGVVSNEVQKIESFAQLASLATEVKRAAKRIAGSSVVKDRRMVDSK
ncbi:MAG: GGDEF domain-containing protein [Pyrinomonadaceae bacterium]